jgi:hypothetical protein
VARVAARKSAALTPHPQSTATTIAGGPSQVTLSSLLFMLFLVFLVRAVFRKLKQEAPELSVQPVLGEILPRDRPELVGDGRFLKQKPQDLFADMRSPREMNRYFPDEDLLWHQWYTQGYLKSPCWREKRRRILQYVGRQCEYCGFKAASEVHHLSYERVRYEEPNDLRALCRRCHERVHGKQFVA